jgi:hypothetical protein
VIHFLTVAIADDLPWDRVAVTWKTFSEMPLSVKSLTKDWQQVSSCQSPNVASPGNIYIFQNDLSIGMIYNDAGHIVGVQFGVQVQPTTPNLPPWQRVNSVKFGTYYALTFYFVDPSNACKNSSTGFTIGDRLVMQNGANINDLISFPLKENQVAAPWIAGKVSSDVRSMPKETSPSPPFFFFFLTVLLFDG